MTRLLLWLPAPAKLNLFLRVLGRRPDGFHELQTAFVAIDLVDTLDFELLDQDRIERHGDLTGQPEEDLAVRAARLLQLASGCPQGVRIDLEKRIPTGAGLGGGSSDAATTLLALNRLWRLNWSREHLAQLALRLGADVPFFLQPGPALGRGVGERLSALALPARWYALIYPQVHVSTAEIFNSVELTEHLKRAKIQGFSDAGGSLGEPAFDDAKAAQAISSGQLGNDLEWIVRRRVPEVNSAIEYLSSFGSATMTGSGASVFAAFETQAQAQSAIKGVPSSWSSWAVAGLTEHPLASW
jgi:4-diphosphocytidyl-2-C-methyl-D-erythritol kinase